MKKQIILIIAIMLIWLFLNTIITIGEYTKYVSNTYTQNIVKGNYSINEDITKTTYIYKIQNTGTKGSYMCLGQCKTMTTKPQTTTTTTKPK